MKTRACHSVAILLIVFVAALSGCQGGNRTFAGFTYGGAGGTHRRTRAIGSPVWWSARSKLGQTNLANVSRTRERVAAHRWKVQGPRKGRQHAPIGTSGCPIEKRQYRPRLFRAGDQDRRRSHLEGRRLLLGRTKDLSPTFHPKTRKLPTAIRSDQHAH